MPESSNLKQSPGNGANPPAQADESAAPAAVRDFIDQVSPQTPDNQADTPAFADNTALPETADKVAAEPAFAPGRLFAKPPTLRHEDRDAYQELQNAAQAAFGPRDLFEYIWAQDFTHLTWEIERGRRLRKALLEGSELEAIRAMVRVRRDNGQLDQFALKAVAAQEALQLWKDPLALKIYGLSKDEIAAQAYRQLHKEIDLLERQMAGWETRRAKLQRDFEARREKQEARTQVMEIVQQARDIIEAHWAQMAEMAENQPVAKPLLGPTQTGAEGDSESYAGARGRANDRTRRRRKGTGLRSGTLGRLRRSKQRHRSDGEAA
jgi:hypothetical protein